MRGPGKLSRGVQGTEKEGGPDNQALSLSSGGTPASTCCVTPLLTLSRSEVRLPPCPHVWSADQGGGEEEEDPGKASWRMEKWAENPLIPLAPGLVPQHRKGTLMSSAC